MIEPNFSNVLDPKNTRVEQSNINTMLKRDHSDGVLDLENISAFENQNVIIVDNSDFNVKTL